MDYKFGMSSGSTKVLESGLTDDFLKNLDPETQRLFYNFLMSISMALSIFLFWLLLRRCRGDKKEINTRGSDVSEVYFDVNFNQEPGGRGIFSKRLPHFSRRGDKLLTSEGSIRIPFKG